MLVELGRASAAVVELGLTGRVLGRRADGETVLGRGVHAMVPLLDETYQVSGQEGLLAFSRRDVYSL